MINGEIFLFLNLTFKLFLSSFLPFRKNFQDVHTCLSQSMKISQQSAFHNNILYVAAEGGDKIYNHWDGVISWKLYFAHLFRLTLRVCFDPAGSNISKWLSFLEDEMYTIDQLWCIVTQNRHAEYYFNHSQHVKCVNSIADIWGVKCQTGFVVGFTGCLIHCPKGDVKHEGTKQGQVMVCRRVNYTTHKEKKRKK